MSTTVRIKVAIERVTTVDVTLPGAPDRTGLARNEVAVTDLAASALGARGELHEGDRVRVIRVSGLGPLPAGKVARRRTDPGPTRDERMALDDWRAHQ